MIAVRAPMRPQGQMKSLVCVNICCVVLLSDLLDGLLFFTASKAVVCSTAGIEPARHG
jgi:hypothetical protein